MRRKQMVSGLQKFSLHIVFLTLFSLLYESSYHVFLTCSSHPILFTLPSRVHPFFSHVPRCLLHFTHSFYSPVFLSSILGITWTGLMKRRDAQPQGPWTPIKGRCCKGSVKRHQCKGRQHVDAMVLSQAPRHFRDTEKGLQAECGNEPVEGSGVTSTRKQAQATQHRQGM